MLLLPARTGLSRQALPQCTCRRAFSLSSRSLVAPYLITTLPARALLSVQGPDSTKFLQGLVSNDVRRLAQRGEEDAPDKHRVVYANILKADVRPRA